MDKEKKTSRVGQFVDAWRDNYQPQSELAIGDADWSLMSSKKSRSTEPISSSDWQGDLLLCEFAFQQRKKRFEFAGTTEHLVQPWADIIEWIPRLSDSGAALCLVPPVCATQPELAKVSRLIAPFGFGIAAALRFPNPQWNRIGSVQSILVVISKRAHTKLFVADVSTASNLSELVDSISAHRDSSSLEQGILFDLSDFRSIEGVIFSLQAAELANQYGDYERKTLGALVTDTHRARRGSQHALRPNAVYVSQMEKARVRAATDPDSLSGSHSNYICLELKSGVTADYVAFYLGTDLGDAYLSSRAVGASIRRVREQDLLAIDIPVPPVATQRTITEADQTLGRLLDEVSGLKADLYKKPVTAGELLTRGRDMLSAIDQLSDADTVRELVRQGESDTVEFKETFSWDLRRELKSDDVELSTLKTIAAFLNTKGGTLLIGVKDDQSIPGISLELKKLYAKKGVDGLLLHLDNKIKKAFNDESINVGIDRQLVPVDGKHVVMVKCTRSPEPVFTGGNVFYVRKTPSTAKLEGRDLANYLREHFHREQH